MAMFDTIGAQPGGSITGPAPNGSSLPAINWGSLPTQQTTPNISAGPAGDNMGPMPNGSNLPAGNWLNLPSGGSFNPAQTTAFPSAPGGSRTDTAQNPTNSTPTTPSTGLRDMGGKTFAGRVIPMGWSMDAQGNWVNTTPAQQTQQYPTVDFNNPTRYLYANGQTYDRTDPNNPYYLAQFRPEFQNLPNQVTQQSQYDIGYQGPLPNLSGQTFQPGFQTPADGSGVGPVAGPTQAATNTTQQNTNQSNQNALGDNRGLMQFLSFLTTLNGGQRGQQSWGTTKTPLGYTQYQQNYPQGNSQDALSAMILKMLLGNNSGGGSQGSFWDLLSSGGGNTSLLN